MKAWVTAVTFSLLSAVPACAEWGLYVNRDGKSWRLEQTFAFESETVKNCKSAARALWATGTVKGVTCQEYSATAFSPTARAREQAAAAAAEAARFNAAAAQAARQEQSRLERREDRANAAANQAVRDAAQTQANATRAVQNEVRELRRDIRR